MCSKMLTSETVLIRAPNAEWSEFPEEVVILDLNSGDYFSIPEVGAFIWKQLDKPSSLSTLIASVQTEYCVEHGLACQDISSFMEQMLAAGLIVIAEDPTHQASQ